MRREGATSWVGSCAVVGLCNHGIFFFLWSGVVLLEGVKLLDRCAAAWPPVHFLSSIRFRPVAGQRVGVRGQVDRRTVGLLVAASPQPPLPTLRFTLVAVTAAPYHTAGSTARPAGAREAHKSCTARP